MLKYLSHSFKIARFIKETIFLPFKIDTFFNGKVIQVHQFI